MPLWGQENMSKNDAYGKESERAWIEWMTALGYEGELY